MGQTRTSGHIRAKSVHPLIADMRRLHRHVGFVPVGDSCTAANSITNRPSPEHARAIFAGIVDWSAPTLEGQGNAEEAMNFTALRPLASAPLRYVAADRETPG
jgi:hypothetical protein